MDDECKRARTRQKTRRRTAGLSRYHTAAAKVKASASRLPQVATSTGGGKRSRVAVALVLSAAPAAPSHGRTEDGDLEIGGSSRGKPSEGAVAEWSQSQRAEAGVFDSKPRRNTVETKGFIAVVASLLALAAFVVAPAVAQAALEPHWYANGVFIKEAEVVKPVTLTSNVTFAVKGEGKAYSTKCSFKASESVTNPTGGSAGTDEFTEFALTKCKLAKSTTAPCGTFSTPEIIVKTPMATKLATAPKGVVLDSVTFTSLEYKCSGTLVKTYTGTLT